METLTINFTSRELADTIAAVQGMVMLVESENALEVHGVPDKERIDALSRYQQLLAKLTDIMQQSDIVQ